MESKAEELKAKGNDQFKKGNYLKAISFYNEALDIKPSEAIYTNRAVSYIQLKDFKKAKEDCHLALNLNPNFGKAYKRLFRVYLTEGHLDKAKESILKAMTLDPADKTNHNDLKVLEDIQAKERVILRSIENKDYSTAVTYVNQILEECVASEHHSIQKIELLLKASQLKEAVNFSRELINNPLFNKSPNIIGWRGKLLVYSGEDVEGRKLLMQALNLDPDNQDLKQAIKNIRRQNDLKEEASALFKSGKLQEAVEKFSECLNIDTLNINYNATIYFNIGIALNKLKKNEEALSNLNKAIHLNPSYAKALVKRGEVNQLLENHEEALRDFQAASHLEPNAFGVQDKIKYAKQKAKEAGKKDYYKIMGVSKDATEDDIKKAYKKLALKWHPDRNQASEEQKEKADKMFKEVNEAYSVLSDPQKRKRFDIGGFDPTDPEGGMSGTFTNASNINPDEIFKMFFSGSGGTGGAGGFSSGGGMGGGTPFFSFGGSGMDNDDIFSGFANTASSSGGARGGRSQGAAGFGGFPGFNFMSGGGGPGGFANFQNMASGGGTANTSEKIKQQEFYKAKIREAFNIVDQERKGIVDKREISYLMRYLLQFPSEAQVRDYIIPKLEDDEPSDYIKYEKFEPYMLQVLMNNEFEPAPAEHLLAAFRILDPEGKGYIKKDVMHQLLTTKGIQLRPTEYEFFKQFALDKTGQYIYYEDYTARLIDENERHLEYLLRGYETFKPSMGK